MNDQIILVDEQDNEIGQMPKLEVHQKGLLHRAFSVFVFNGKGEILLQQRAWDKYHSAGLWSNTCCSHPAPGEEIYKAAERRLMEEMGLTCILIPVFNFIYKAELENGLMEYELDHVLFGTSDALPVINKSEVNDFKFMDMQTLSKDIDKNPQKYTAWLRRCIDMVLQHSGMAKAGNDSDK